MEIVANKPLWRPHDLVGCRYRRRQKTSHPDWEATAAAKARAQRLDYARADVLALLPTRPQIADNKYFTRIDLVADEETRWFSTLEALASQATLITGAYLTTVVAGREFGVEVDALVRHGDAYMPLIVSNHRVARKAHNKLVKTIDTRRIGLGLPHTQAYKLKPHSTDSYQLALAARALDDLGLDIARGIIIGQNRTLGFIVNTELFQQGLDHALAQPIPQSAHRVKECGGCRFWRLCHTELTHRDDISLVFSGDKGRRFKEAGITTVTGLINAQPTSVDGQIAQCWQRGEALMKKVPVTSAPRFDVEIDIDVEAYLDQGAYLWGAFDGDEYRPFVTWEDLGGVAEAKNFAHFWQWLQGRREHAHSQGLSVGVFCYSQHGENHWLRSSAARFYPAYHKEIPGLPSPAEVEAFIDSHEWIDIFALIRAQFEGTAGLGLKVVAPITGYHWQVPDLDGEGSVNLYLEAIGVAALAPASDTAKAALLSYNGDDCRATAAVREFLHRGAPSIPGLRLGELES
ncbi:TM0106 family RecB-like putative nuclease [Corynebacterium sp. ES2794-CONJ1]|uniref:TM0106 family RecB-like putative nuclease n=1 Tax=Corynebacterium sp. ES2794-CONJ1 TaxID=2980553 RepID=UPI0021D825D2|nr:TM0106 family RecB-like putative nuclease [Corynebacterium sp. ES2794-CONJ1]MCU9519612.1 TM0106 family RecB-like putative nuclease [Corynebacterium sp. ES2794-CONJ1]